MRRTLEDILLEEGLCDEAALRQLRRAARQAGVSLGHAATQPGQLSDDALAEVLARRLRLPRVKLDHELVDEDAVREVPYDLADRRRLLPLSIDRVGDRRVMRVAMVDPLDRDAVEEIEMSTGCFVDPVVVRGKDVADAVRRHYRGVITKMIPRPPDPGEQRADADREANDAPPEVQIRALVELLEARGLIESDAWAEAVRRLLRASP